MKKKKSVGLVTTLVLSLVSPQLSMGQPTSTNIPAKTVLKEQKKPMKNWSDYFNSVGLLTEKNKDGGDTPSHESFARFCAKLDPTVSFPSPITWQQFVSLVVLPNGQLIRNPVDYPDPLDGSRDQYRGITMASIAEGDDDTAHKMGQSLPRNFLDYPKYPNGDIFTHEDKVMFNRDIMVLPEQYISILFADLLTFLGVVWLCFWSTREPNLISKFLGRWFWVFTNMEPPNAQGIPQSPRGASYTSGDLGQFMLLVQGATQRPTFLNRLSRWVYGKFRPNGIQWAFDSYFANDNDPPVNTLTPNLIQRYFK